MGLLSVSADGIGAIAAGARANQIVQVSDAGVLVLAANVPAGQRGGHYSVFENGAAGPTAAGLGEWASTAFGAGASRAALTSEAGWFNGSAAIETGTTTTGQFLVASKALVQFSATSGLWVYEIPFSIPVLSDGTDTWSLQLGPAFGFSAGASLKYTHGVNGGRFQYVTTTNSVSTAVDSGITAVAGTYYHLRIEALNDTLASFYLITTFTGTTWSDTGVWTSPTTIATNVPSGSGNQLFGSIALVKSAGTTSRKLKYQYQSFYRVPPFTRVEATSFISSGKLGGGDGVGQGIGSPLNALGVSSRGTPGWLPPIRIKAPIVFYAYGRGGWVGSNNHDFGFVMGGTAGAGDRGTECVDNHLLGTTGIITGFIADGYCAFATAIALKIDASVNPIVFETVCATAATLSSVGAPFSCRSGLFNLLTAAPTSGIWVDADSKAAGALQCKTRVGGVTTTTTTGITIVADTNYLLRIIATATSVTFLVAANDGAVPTPIVITTNIPTAVAMCAADVIRSSGATGLCKMRLGYALCYQRSTT